MIISFCGDICSECPRYLATVVNTEEELNRVAKMWFRFGFRDHIVDPEEIKCNGCDKQKPCSYGLYDCKHIEGKSNCGECNFFPCGKFELVFEKSNRTDNICKELLNTTEYAQIKRAFFMKQEILNGIHNQKFIK
jgi:hypothetical protein